MIESSAPKTRGIASALWSLVQPDRFTSQRPRHRSVRYRPERCRGIQPLADVYLPDGPGPHPSVILVHGGAYLIGSKGMKPMRFLATELIAAGYAALAINYRMIFRGGRFVESLQDVASATDWWFQNAHNYACDPTRVAILGVSAGAALVLKHVEQSGRRDLTRIINVYGLYDFTYLSGQRTRWLRKRTFRSSNPAVWAQASSVGHCHTEAPMLILHGSQDTILPVAHAHRLHAHREAEGLPSEIVIFDGAGHSFLNVADHPATLAALAKIRAFLDRDDARRHSAS